MARVPFHYIMFFILKIQTLKVHEGFTTDDGKQETFSYVEVETAYDFDQGYIKLDTSEVFTDPRLMHHHKGAQLIGFSLIVSSAQSSDEFSDNKILYRKGSGTEDDYWESSIFARCNVPPDQYTTLLKNVRSGLFPSRITIEIGENVDRGDDAPLEYGWEPDGSGIIWHNKRSGSLPIQGVRFFYPVLELPRSALLEDEPRAHDPVPFNISKQLDDGLSQAGNGKDPPLTQIVGELATIKRILLFIFFLFVAAAISQAFGL